MIKIGFYLFLPLLTLLFFQNCSKSSLGSFPNKTRSENSIIQPNLNKEAGTFVIESKEGNCSNLHISFRRLEDEKVFDHDFSDICNKQWFLDFQNAPDNSFILAREAGLFPKLTPYYLLEATGNSVKMDFKVRINATGEEFTYSVNEPYNNINFYGDKRPDKVAEQITNLAGKISSLPPIDYDGCDSLLLAEENLNSYIQSRTSTNPTNICLGPGLIQGPILIINKTNLTLKGLSFTEITSKEAPNDNNPLLPSQGSTIYVLDSRNIVFENLKISNEIEYDISVDHKIARALSINQSSSITILNSQISSKGKQTLFSTNAEISINDSELNCYYFCISPVNSSIFSINSKFTQNHLTMAGDTHSLFWTSNSNYNFQSSTFDFITGKRFITGFADQNRNSISVENATIISPPDSLTEQHPNYHGIVLYWKGELTSSVESWTFNVWNDPQTGTGPSNYVKVCRGLSNSIACKVCENGQDDRSGQCTSSTEILTPN